MSVSVVLKNVATTIGEGPHWDVEAKVLWFVDIEAGDVYKYDPATDQHSKVHLDGPVGFAIPTKGHPEGESLVVGLGTTISLLSWKTGKATCLENMEPGTKNRCNDAKCDPSGRLWAGTMGPEEKPAEVERQKGSLYSLTKGKLKHHLGKIDISNGIDWTEDQKTMYYIDSYPRKIYVFDYDIANGEISNQRTAVDFGEGTVEERGFPDGCCLDTEGKLWVACYNSGKVIRFDPETGKEIQHVKMPVKRVTSCCFGGDNLDELYVTCGKNGVTEEEFANQEQLAGSLFKVSGLGVRGRPMNYYQYS